MRCRLVCTSSRLYLLRLACVLVNPVPASVIVPDWVIHAIEIAILGCRHLDFAMPNIPLRKPHHRWLLLPRAQIYHARCRIVALSIIRKERRFCISAAEKFPKRSIAIAALSRFRQSSTKHIPRIVVAQLLRYAASAVVNILCFDFVPRAGTGIRG